MNTLLIFAALRAFNLVALQDLERLVLGADPRKARDGNPMEEEEVSGILAQEVPARVGQTADSGSPHRVHPSDIVRSSRIRRGSHRPKVGGEIRRPPCLLDRPEIHGQKAPMQQFSSLEKLPEEPGQGHVDL